MNNMDQIFKEVPLVKLIQEENFIGWTFSIDYDTALVMTNDLWKAKAMGIPHNCFLVAASFDPKSFSSVDEITVCDLTGVGIQDTQIARLAYKKAVERGLGTVIQEETQ